MIRLALAAALAASIAIPGNAAGGAVLLIGNKGEDSVSFVDLDTGKELGRSATGKMPHEIAVSPDGGQAAVVSYGGTSVDIFDVARRTWLKTIDLAPNAGPHGIAWLKDGRLIITTERSRSLTVSDPVKGVVAASIKTDQAGTHMVAVSSDGGLAYTANIGAGTVSVIDLKSNRKLRDLPVGGKPEGIALSNDDRSLWVADLDAPRVQIFDTLVRQDWRSRHRANADPGCGKPRRTVDRHLQPGQRQLDRDRRKDTQTRPRRGGVGQHGSGAGNDPVQQEWPPTICRRNRAQHRRRSRFGERQGAAPPPSRQEWRRSGDRGAIGFVIANVSQLAIQRG